MTLSLKEPQRSKSKEIKWYNLKSFTNYIKNGPVNKSKIQKLNKLEINILN